MKKLFLSFIFTSVLYANAFAYQNVENYTVQENLTIDTITYYNNSYIEPRNIRYKNDCNQFKSSIDLSRRNNCYDNCNKPIKVKTYTEVIDHYQIYKPVTTYVPAGTFSTRRVIK